LSPLLKIESIGDFLRQAAELPQLPAIFSSLQLQKNFEARPREKLFWVYKQEEN